MPKIYAVQLDLAWEDRPANLAAAGSLVVLPEMFDVGFTMNAAVATDEPAGVTRTALAAIARERSIHLIAGLVADDPLGRPANTAFVFSPRGDVVARYRKVHPFTPAGEHLAYAAGDGPIVFDWHGVTVAPTICYDLRFPELYRSAVDLGAELFVAIASWPSVRAEHWSLFARARAIENQATMVAVNRCGRDPNLAYPGRSVIVGPRGEILAEAGDAPTTLVADFDVATVRDWRRDYPALRDRKLDREAIAPFPG